MITTKEKIRILENIDQHRIYLYDLKQAEKEIKKGPENVRVLYSLLIKEINQHNGAITKKYRKVRNEPTID